MAVLAIQNLLANAKMEPVYSAVAAGGDTFVPASTDGKLVLHFKNGNVAARTVTINDVGSVSPVGATAFNPDIAVVVDATDACFVELANLERFKDPTTGAVAMTYSADADLTVAVLRLA